MKAFGLILIVIGGLFIARSIDASRTGGLVPSRVLTEDFRNGAMTPQVAFVAGLVFIAGGCSVLISEIRTARKPESKKTKRQKSSENDSPS
ncbi:hypothetical protein ASA1KI_27130 [Opitutales bacterium ASA1]|nr:hypothetical protein ASA1KI_27130 [Opitutales bacterium ASA1]